MATTKKTQAEPEPKTQAEITPDADVTPAEDAGPRPDTVAEVHEARMERSDTDSPGRTVHVAELSPEGETAARTSDGPLTDEDADLDPARYGQPEVPKDGRFHKVFVVKARDYADDQPHEDMHRANMVATLQEALNRGMHPEGEARLDDHTERTPDGSVRLRYSVAVLPAHLNRNPAEAYTPRKAIVDMGGSTVEQAQVDPADAKAAEARTQRLPDAPAGPGVSATTVTPQK